MKDDRVFSKNTEVFLSSALIIFLLGEIIGVGFLADKGRVVAVRVAAAEDAEHFSESGDETETGVVGMEEVEPVPLPVERSPARRKQRKSAVNPDVAGTKALNRFETDMIAESQYQLNDRPLEVDPD